MQGEILQVKSDRLFHDLINENEMDTIEWLVMQLLECNYEDIHGKVTVKNIRLTRINKKERNKYVDLIVSYKNEKIIIELNNNFDGVYVRNLLFGMNQLMNNYQLGIGNYYKEITRIFLVNLNWHNKNKGNFIDGKKIYEIPYSDLESDGYLFKIVNVNLDYYSKLCYDNVDVKDKIYKLLTIKSKDELNKLIKNEKLLKRYGNKLINLSSDKDYMEDIMSEEIEEFVEKHVAYRGGLNEGIKQGIEKGLEQGLEQGILKKQKEIVLNMYKKDYELKDISEITNLSIEEIKEILKDKEL